MTQPQDAALLAALELQAQRLTIVLHRLENARRELVPAHAQFWRGSARNAYVGAVGTVGTTVDSGIAAVRSARDGTSAAIAAVTARG